MRYWTLPVLLLLLSPELSRGAEDTKKGASKVDQPCEKEQGSVSDQGGGHRPRRSDPFAGLIDYGKIFPRQGQEGGVLAPGPTQGPWVEGGTWPTALWQPRQPRRSFRFTYPVGNEVWLPTARYQDVYGQAPWGNQGGGYTGTCVETRTGNTTTSTCYSLPQ